jgi:outer membrane protein assembly factor BamE (lipoprotein component of BamABCDE complex)
MQVKMTGTHGSREHRGRRRRALSAWFAVASLGLALAGCSGISFSQVYQRGYVLPDGALEQVPIGASQEQVLIVLGTPSTVATVSGEVFYYISQRGVQSVAFLPQKVTDQRVIAVYFDKERRVERLANYGMKDGKVFDFVSRTTPTGGQELSYIGYLLKAASL